MLPEKTSPENQERSSDRRNDQQQPEDHAETQFTRVPNAHAAGLGAMGRNDEKLPSSEDGEDQPDEPAY